jgi:hypothetical protein
VEGLDDGPDSAMAYLVGGGRHELLELRRVRSMLQSKWDGFGKHLLFTRMMRHLVLLSVFQFGIALPPVSASLASPDGLFSSVSGPLRIVCELVVFVHAMSKLKSEGIELRNGGLWGYFGVGGALLLENITSMTYCSAILVTVVARIIGDRMMESASLALASFACWFYLPYFCMGFRLTGPFVVMLITMMHSDIPAFLLVAVTFLGAFASALFILSQEVGFEAMLTNFQLCGFPFLDAFEESHFHDIYNHWPRLGPTIITVYVMMVTLVMMNLLIARMGDTYNRISDSAELEWLLQRARVVRGMENELNDAEHEEIMNHFLVLDRVGKPCLQVKEVDHGYWRKSKNESSAGQA